jgi:RNA polymerase sigma factor (sigma-70 family)
MNPHEPADTARPFAPPGIDHEFSTFYRLTVKHLVGFLILQGGSPVDAADIAQDTMCTAYRRWSDIEHPRAWAFRVASRGLARRMFAVETPTAMPPEPPPLWAGGEADLAALRTDLVEALATLPPRQRQVLAWSLYEYTPAEIAEELGIDVDAVRSSLYKARRAIGKDHLR